MGKKKSSPSPPKIGIPKPSAEELKLQKMQSEQIAQQISQSDILFAQGQDDRGLSRQYLQELTGERELTDTERMLAQQLSDQYFDIGMRNITTGANQEAFNINRRDTIAGLIDAGLMNSTTGVDLLGSLEKDRLRMIGDAGQQAALQNLLLKKDFLDKGTAVRMDLFNSLRGGAQGNSALSAQLSNQAVAGAGNLSGQLRQNRMDAHNVMAQNKMARYQHKLMNSGGRGGFGQLGGAVGSALGLGAGLLLAPATGGASMLMAGGLGASLGGGLGSAVGGLF